MLRTGTLLLALALPATLAAAQPAATVRVTADGTQGVLVTPGQPVRVSVTVAHNTFQLAGIQGGSVVDGHAGTASAFSTLIPNLPTMNLGAFQGGSRVGAEIAVTPQGFPSGPWPQPPFNQNPTPIWQYDLTFDHPGTYAVNWLSPMSAPNVRLYEWAGSFSYVEAQTTYIGAIITVVPSPTTASLFVLAVTATRRRRAF